MEGDGDVISTRAGNFCREERYPPRLHHLWRPLLVRGCIIRAGALRVRGGNSETLATHPVVYVFLGGVCKLSYCRLRHANLLLISQ